MADTREIKIVLETRGGSSGSGSDDAERVDQSVASETEQSGKSGSSGKAAAAALVKAGIETVINEGVAWASYYINREYNLNDDYIGQRNLAIATQQIGGAVSAISTMSNFALIGSIGGPVGAAIGAVVGFGVAALQIGRNNYQAMDQQDIHLRQLDAQLSFTRERSGWSLQAASIGENL